MLAAPTSPPPPARSTPVWGAAAASGQSAAGGNLPRAFAREAAAALADGLMEDALNRALYSTDASIYQIEPLAACTPLDADEVSALLRLAHAHGVNVIPRGGGSGLAGESLGRAVVFDLSKHMTRILDVDPAGAWVRAEAGLVLDVLNRVVAPLGRKLGPDPASGSRCTVGGVVANNSSGAHSLYHGLFRDHILELEAVLSNGERVVLKPYRLDSAEYRAITSRDTLEARLYKRVESLCRDHAQLVHDKWPHKLNRHRSGYLMHGVLREPTPAGATAPERAHALPVGETVPVAPDHATGRIDPARATHIDLAQLVCGSEGTLAVVTAAKLALVPMPRARALVMFLYDNLVTACQSVSPILAHRPYACELLDRNIIRMARGAGFGYEKHLPEGADALLMVEFEGADDAEVAARIEACVTDIVTARAMAFSHQVALTEHAQATLWKIRKSGEPLLYRRPGHAHPVGFIEDTSVDPHRLGEYIAGKEAIFARHGVEYATYAHAGAGVLHTRPFLDLSQPDDLDKMEAIADEVYELLLSLGGSISGEHGDGLARTAYLVRQFGPELYDVFHQVKAAFDPENRLNPGKIVNNADPRLVRRNLRHGEGFTTAGAARQPFTNLLWAPGELEKEADKCNGCGECRAVDRIVAMCPIFKVTGDEAASPRAKGNLMRLMTSGQLDPQWAKTDEFKKTADKCVNCKACFIECPVNVNIPMMMIEAKAEWVRENGQPLTNQLMIQAELVSKINCMVSPLANWVARNPIARWFMEKTAGIDRRRKLPAFHGSPYLGRQQGDVIHQPAEGTPETGRRVVYFVDLFANYNDPELAEAFVKVFTHNGVTVAVPKAQEGCGMPAMDYGSVDAARAIIRRNASAMRPWIDKGYTVVTQEPTATLSLKDEYLYFVRDADTEALAENARDAMDFLRDLDRDGLLRKDFVRPAAAAFAYQLPCHLKALHIGTPGVDVIRQVPGATVTPIAQGCCGIAGTWGMKKTAFDISMASGKPMLDTLNKPDFAHGLSECSTCKMQMEQGSEKKTLHPLKVLAHAYGLMDVPGL